jgi:peptidoglycan/LPS O-acetylase OafA/YrhL
LDLYTTYTLYWMWAMLFIVPFCLLSYALVEKPWMKIGDAWRRRTTLREKQLQGS